MLSLKINFSLDCLQSRQIFLHHKSCFNVFEPPDSRVPRRDTPEKRVSSELDFHWFPVDKWGFEVFGPWIRVPASRYPRKACFRWARFPLVPRRPMGFEVNGSRIRVLHLLKPCGSLITVKSRCIGCLATIVIKEKRTPDSSSPRRVTPGNIQYFSQLVSLRTMFFWPGYKQTNRQTNNHLFRKTLLSVEGIMLNLDRCSLWWSQKTEISTFRSIPLYLEQYSWTALVVLVFLGPGFIFPASRLFRKACFRPARFPLVPVDQWIFEVFGPRIRVPRIEIPQKIWFSASSISIGSRRPMGFRGVWASDSCSRVEIPQKNLITAKSIFIGSGPTNGVSR